MSENIVNLSTVYADVPRDARPQAAANDGFKVVESWWDFDSATPSQSELDGFIGALEKAGTELYAINSYAGNRNVGECGLACLPSRVEEFRFSIEAMISVAERTGTRFSNVAFGAMSRDLGEHERQWQVARQNYTWAAERFADVGGTILIEALMRGDNRYPFHTGYDLAEFMKTYLAEVSNIGIVFDAFHLAANGIDPSKAFEDLHHRIKHVQIADFPGRGRPGTGTIDFERLSKVITASRYRGEIALEYFG